MAKPRKRRRKLSMTSLIDVIFLLLLFFMLTSTFSKFSEVDLSAGGAGISTTTSDTKPLFLQLGKDEIRLNGEVVRLENLATSSLERAEEGTVLLVALGADVTSQRLSDLLVSLRGLPALRITVLGG